MFRIPAALLCAFACLACAAAPRPGGWSGTVSHVSDGDTLWVRPAAGGAPRKIRLHGIGAPELCQAHGRAARGALQQQVLHRPVQVEPLRRDDYDRLLARLFVAGQDVGALLVREGHAWSYRYRRSPGPYPREERAARSARLGLFADSQAQRPYAFRRQHGPCTP